MESPATTGGVWSRRGHRLAYTSTRRTGRDTGIYVVDPADPASDRLLLAVDGGGWTVLDWFLLREGATD